MDVRSGRLPEHALRGRGLELRELTDRADAVAVQLLRRHRADAPQPLDGERQEELLLPIGLDDEESVGLAHRTRDLREELRAGDADRDRQARLGAHPLPQPDGDGLGSAGDASQAADLEESLVDGEPLHERGGVAEDAEDVLAGRGVGLHPRRHDDGVGAQLAPAGRPSPCGRPAPSPRSSRPARPRRRRSPGARGAPAHHAARPRRRTHRDRHAEPSLPRASRSPVDERIVARTGDIGVGALRKPAAP